MGAKHAKKHKERFFRVLVLGTAGSGKSTFFKQMKIINNGGFTEVEVDTFRTILLQNLVAGIQDLIREVDRMELSISEPNRKVMRFLMEVRRIPECDGYKTKPVDRPGLDPIVLKKIKTLWADNAIQKAWTKCDQQIRFSNFAYLIGNLDNYATPNYAPTHDDILRARQRTTGVSRVEFRRENFRWELVDVGGQACERMKWEPVIDEGCCAVIFLAALDEYNIASTEEAQRTKMYVAMETFQDVVTSPKLYGVAKILFLNKVDLFERKIKSPEGFSDFKRIYKNYTGTDDCEEACDFMVDTFRDLVPGSESQRIPAHITCALDTEAIATVFEAVKDNIFLSRMSGGENKVM